MLIFCAAKGPPVQRKPLKHRDYEVDLESRLGKTQVSCLIFILLSTLAHYLPDGFLTSTKTHLH